MGDAWGHGRSQSRWEGAPGAGRDRTNFDSRRAPLTESRQRMFDEPRFRRAQVCSRSRTQCAMCMRVWKCARAGGARPRRNRPPWHAETDHRGHERSPRGQKMPCIAASYLLSCAIGSDIAASLWQQDSAPQRRGWEDRARSPFRMRESGHCREDRGGERAPRDMRHDWSESEARGMRGRGQELSREPLAYQEGRGRGGCVLAPGVLVCTHLFSCSHH